jgi:OOP family OmpA-OmpF porin
MKTKKRRKDMKKYYLTTLFIVMISTLLISCGGKKVMKTAPSFEPYKFDASQYVPKVDNFVVILDTSSSMADKYGKKEKAKIAKELLTAMNQTLPELNYNGALITFGHDAHLPDKSAMLVYGPTKYSTAGFGSALNATKGPGGDSSLALAKAINASGVNLKSAQGPIAVILVSDGEKMDQAPLKAAEALKSQFGDRLCIDTVLVGDNPAGKMTLEQIAKAGGCGISTTADQLASSANMAGFVKGLFLAKPAPKPAPMAAAPKPMDSDKDGVTDNLDQCPNTPMGATVDARGCWTYAAKVLFDINSAEVKSEAYPMLQEAVLIMKKNPDLKVEVDGHTDSTGTAAYNMTLSVKRAEAIKDHFVSRGIDPNRLTTKGFGFTNPAASNDTKEGRAKNRRVELTPVK